MDGNEALELLFLIAVVVLPALFLWSHFAAKRRALQQHQQLVSALADHQQATVGALQALLEAKLPAHAPQEVMPQETRPQPSAQPQPSTKISEDKLMVIGAVLACHFGKRVKVRSARRVMAGGGSNVWSQQGRAAVQAMRSGFR
jgi:hypothetical protein